MERKSDDLRGDVGREARESLRGQRHERLPVGLLVAFPGRDTSCRWRDLNRLRPRRCLQCLFSWQLPLTEFSLRRVAIAWAPFGLQCAGDKRYVLRSMALEILYAPLVLLLGSGLVLYGALHIAKDMLLYDAESDFWRLNSDGQVRRVRATLISIVATSVTAVPQIFLQSYAYASAAVPLTPAGERLVIASISFSLLSLLRSICGLLASWRKIRFTFQRVNGNLEAEVFNGCLHECADAAERTTSPQSRKRFIAFFCGLVASN